MDSKVIKTVTGISLLLFSPLLLSGFLMHPDIFVLETTHTVEAMIANFRHQPLFHVGHLLVFVSVPFIIFALSGLTALKIEREKGWILAGWLSGTAGAVILAGDKGALCMVLSAFDTLSEAEFRQISPALETILQRRGQLALFYALPLLPLGASAQLVGLIQSGHVKRLSGILGITGLFLLNNPDIEIISSVGALLMIFCYFPLGIRLIKGEVE